MKAVFIVLCGVVAIGLSISRVEAKSCVVAGSSYTCTPATVTISQDKRTVTLQYRDSTYTKNYPEEIAFDTAKEAAAFVRKLSSSREYQLQIPVCEYSAVPKPCMITKHADIVIKDDGDGVFSLKEFLSAAKKPNCESVSENVAYCQGQRYVKDNSPVYGGDAKAALEFGYGGSPKPGSGDAGAGTAR